MRSVFMVCAAFSLLLLATSPAVATEDCELSDVERLGKLLLFDDNLSINGNQACAACHAPMVGGTGPRPDINATGSVHQGSVPGRFGNRKPPTTTYAGDSPVLHQDDEGTWTGGMFWDGRATGSILGDPLAEQAQGPFLNPLEQALPDAGTVLQRVCDSVYGDLFRDVWGGDACRNVDAGYEAIARSIAAYERSIEVTPFSSKFDAYLTGRAELTPQEDAGLAVFNGPGQCFMCHPSAGDRPLFTDFTYDNLGVPANPLNPFYYEPEVNPAGTAWVDEGLGGFLRGSGESPAVYEPELGKMKVPTLRNVDLRPAMYDEKLGRFVKAFGHNGSFKSLEEIVHFYNTRDVLDTCAADDPGVGVTCWPEPEIAENVNTDELGNLGLTEEQEAALVAYLTTLSDGYFDACDDDSDDESDDDATEARTERGAVMGSAMVSPG